MKTSILQSLSKEEAETVEQEFKRCPTLRRRLTELLNKRRDEILTTMYDEKMLESPNWGALQAQKAGRVKEVSKLIALLEN